MQLPPDQRFVAFAEPGGCSISSPRAGSAATRRHVPVRSGRRPALAEQMQSQSDKDDVTGTPTFFINGRKIDAIQLGRPRAGAAERRGEVTR
jgi:hypothetical protein